MKKPLSLRSYLVAVFVPLAVLPLVALALWGNFLLGRAVEQEILRRARPELLALNLDFEKIDSELLRSIKEMPISLSPEWFQKSLFDEVKIYDSEGRLVKNLAAPSDRELSHRLKTLLDLESTGPKGSLSLRSRISRNPASQSFFSLNSRFESAQEKRMGRSFRSFLSRGELWSVKETVYRKLRVDFVFYRAVKSKKLKGGINFVAAKFSVDSPKMALLSKIHGTENFIMSPEGNFLAASFDYRKWVGDPLQLDSSRPQSRPLLGKAFSFYLAPLEKEDHRLSAWVGVGVSRVEAENLQRKNLVGMGIFTVILGLAVTLATWLVSTKVTEPISRLVEAVTRMKEGQWVEPVQGLAQSEMAYLTQKFNEMTLKVQSTQRALEQKFQELSLAQEQLVQSAKLSSLGQLVAGVAHELNNPIAFIYSNMSQLREYQRDFERLDEFLEQVKPRLPPGERVALQNFLKDIQWQQLLVDLRDISQSSLEGSIRVKDIVLGLRNFSRLDQASLEEKDLHELLRNTVKLLQHEWRDRITLEWKLCESLRISCYPNQLNQVFVNLLANAFQAIEGRGRVEILTKQIEIEGAAWAEIKIKDSGRGIASEDLSKIFDPFFTTKEIGKGTGLGLSIVYGIVQKHGGRIEVKSVQSPAENCGTEFRILIPFGTESMQDKSLAS